MEQETLEKQMIDRIMRFEAGVKDLKEQEKGLVARSDELKKILEDLEAKAGKEQPVPLIERIVGLIGQGAKQGDITASLSEARKEKLRSDDRDLMIRAVKESIRKLEGLLAAVQKKISDALTREIIAAMPEFEAEYNEAFSAAVAYPVTWRKIVRDMLNSYGIPSFGSIDILRITRPNHDKWRPFEGLMSR